MQQWEYRIVTGQNTLTEVALNQLGSEGWELVGLSSHVESSQVRGDNTIIICVFKRPKQ